MIKLSDRRIIGDTLPFEYELKWNDGTPIDLRDVATVYLIMRLDDASSDEINGECVITDAENGKVAYNFSSTEIDTGGMYKYRYKINYVSGKILTVPSNDVLWLYLIDPTWM